MIPGWSRRILLVLAAEKVVQRLVVTALFATGATGIRETVAVDWRWLMWLGLLLAVLFAAGAVGLVRRQRCSLPLLAALALADIVGEFIAQGRLFITLNISFIVAALILAIAIPRWHATRSAL